jgi:CAAX prenyl protease-like protein
MRAIFPRAIPFAVFIAFIGLSGPLTRVAESTGMDPRWWYGVRILVVAVLLASYWRSYVELRVVARVPAGDWLRALAIGVVVFILWINLDFKPLAIGDAPGFDPRGSDGTLRWTIVTVRLAGAAIVVPVMEELFWRSFVMRWVENQRFLEVDPKRVGILALGLTSAAFALEHDLWFAGLLAGLGYGWLYTRTGNLWAPVVSHAVTNALLGAWVLFTGSWQFW